MSHDLNLTDDKPYREPYRRIPPSMFDEVREHLREILEIDPRQTMSIFYTGSLTIYTSMIIVQT
jgi:hypothetical protein